LTITGAVYCGAPPVPGELWGRFNLDPVLLTALALLTVAHCLADRRDGKPWRLAASGWVVATLAFTSPLCALSVSLFSARIAQHMILILIAAPIIASSLSRYRIFFGPSSLWAASALFFAALWFWHMPAPYEATFASPVIYWAMHISLFGSAIWLWAALLRQHSAHAFAAGALTSMQMGLLGAVICFASWPMYRPHYATTEAWGFTPLADQQLGGALMWVPGCLLFLWVAMRCLGSAWRSLEEAAA